MAMLDPTTTAPNLFEECRRPFAKSLRQAFAEFLGVHHIAAENRDAMLEGRRLMGDREHRLSRHREGGGDKRVGVDDALDVRPCLKDRRV